MNGISRHSRIGNRPSAVQPRRWRNRQMALVAALAQVGVVVGVGLAPAAAQDTCGGLSSEAEAGAVYGAMTVVEDGSASGGAYVQVADQTGNAWSPGSDSRVELCFTVGTAGVYRIDGTVQGTDPLSDSFFVDAANQADLLWDVPRPGAFAVDSVSDRGGADPVLVDMDAGRQIVTFTLREDGTRLDSVDLVLVEPRGDDSGTSFELSSDQERLALSRYAADQAGLVDPSLTAEVTDEDDDNKVSAGDRLTVRDGNGNVTVERTLSEDDVYDFLLRAEIVDVTRSIGRGWRFTSNGFVEIVGDAERYNPPISRPYVGIYNSGSGTETVQRQNQYWEQVQREDGTIYIIQREDVSAAAAVQDLFNNSDRYRFECGGVIPVVHLKAMLNLLGAERFDEVVTERVMFSSFYDGYNPTNLDSNRARWDSGLGAWHYRNARAGDVVVDGVANLRGELALFDPTANNRFGRDRLEVGSMFYFDEPGDNETSTQGWNAYYLGESNGVHEFWSVTVGVYEVTFQSGEWIPTTDSIVRGTYLGSLQRSPDANLLELWDNQNLAG